jgi:PAS domain S-box-containing protein
MSHAALPQEKPVARGHVRHRAGKPHPVPQRADYDSSDLGRAFELAALIESATDAVVGVCPAGSITRWGEGAERLFGYSQAEALGRPITLLAPPNRIEEPGALIRRAMSGERIERLETERVRKDGGLLDAACG